MNRQILQLTITAFFMIINIQKIEASIPVYKVDSSIHKEANADRLKPFKIQLNKNDLNKMLPQIIEGAEKGDISSLTLMGVCYEIGVKVKSNSLAYAYYLTAYKLGAIKLKDKIVSLQNRMNSNRLRNAEALANKLLARIQSNSKNKTES